MTNKDELFAGASRASCKEQATRYASFKITEMHGSTMLVWMDSPWKKGKFSLFPSSFLYLCLLVANFSEIVSR